MDGSEKLRVTYSILADSTGLLLAIVVYAADLHDCKAIVYVVSLLKDRFCRFLKFF